MRAGAQRRGDRPQHLGPLHGAGRERGDTERAHPGIRVATDALGDAFGWADERRGVGELEGNGGSDTLDYSAFTTPVTANLLTGVATAVGGKGGGRGGDR